jgi:F-type H+-transporting ATPase subunit gamma
MTWEATRRRRQAVATVHDVVTAMRAIAAGRIQSAQRALASARSYHEVVLRAMATLIFDERPLPALAGGRPTILVVMSSEQPFCGSFNHDVLEFAEHRFRALCEAGTVHLLVVGQRGMRQLKGRGIFVEGGESAATSLEGLHDLVKRLADLLGKRFATGELETLRVIFNRHQSLTEQVPTEVQILPLDLDQVRRAARTPARRFHRYLSPPELLEGLVEEYVFISLYLIAAESFAGEQASRLVAMDSATRNTERMLEALTDLERRERQGEITREVIELIAARIAAESADG